MLGKSFQHHAPRVAAIDLQNKLGWPQFARAFIEDGTYLRKGTHVSFAFNPLTTQIEPHDTYAELFAVIMRINTILVDVTQDMWRYISDEWIVQKAVSGEVGSSAMPHKVNPVNFENAEGNLQTANWLMEGCCRKLPVSRLQRDLSDTTVARMFGTIFGHCVVGYENLRAGMKKVSPDAGKIRQALLEHPEVLAEAYQTILRSKGYPNAYDALKSLSRGAKITLADLHAFVDGLDTEFIDDEAQEDLNNDPVTSATRDHGGPPVWVSRRASRMFRLRSKLKGLGANLDQIAGVKSICILLGFLIFRLGNYPHHRGVIDAIQEHYRKAGSCFCLVIARRTVQPSAGRRLQHGLEKRQRAFTKRRSTSWRSRYSHEGEEE
ncbi:lyase family protein [Bradyrhizobium sp. WSM2254]|uniref:lyase family protein n=1 Tax=Bradyrhizobium sp. WSM2254 TaxID=1188263 RepID=UPI00040D2BA1|nr:lyase family protein [Bradyrhizobium sp. WSM2254]